MRRAIFAAMITVTSIGIADRFPVQSLRHVSRYRIRIDAESNCFLARNIKDHLSIMQPLSKENSDAGFVILQVSSRLRSAVPDYSCIVLCISCTAPLVFKYMPLSGVSCPYHSTPCFFLLLLYVHDLSSHFRVSHCAALPIAENADEIWD